MADPINEINTGANPPAARTPKRPAPKKKKKSKSKGPIIIAIVALLLVGGFAFIALNIGGFRENTLMPYLRNMPLVGGLFPAAPPETDEQRLEDMTPAQLIAMINSLNTQVNRYNEEVRAWEQQHERDQERIAFLNDYYRHWESFLALRTQLDTAIVYSDPAGFVAIFPYIWEESARELLPHALAISEHNEATRSLVNTLINMQEGNAAEIMENLLTTDNTLLVNVLRIMSDRQRAVIMDEMDPAVATIMMRLISVPAPTLTPILPPALTPQELDAVTPALPTIPDTGMVGDVENDEELNDIDVD